ncbi:MAG: CCA tRNA nucleotidyltransferase [Planctomycetota bacterium]|jgi:tRNA nucleotidyltransferase/poly(A) polymerase
MTNRETAVKVIKKLHKEGFEALLAGGCVRDMLLKRRAKDYDVATNAKPTEVIKLFRRTLKVGAKFGVIIVLLKDKQVEVATFRTETDYADGRHPGKVVFSTAAEDASRRDFTVNGMFYDPIKRKTIDYVKGKPDLKKGIIRTIGEPSERFSEDYLRMLRAVRFSSQLGFKIEPKTYSAICKHASKIKGISSERQCTELEGILVCVNRAKGAAMFIDTGLARTVFPNFAGKKTALAVEVLSCLPKKIGFALALSAFFAGCGNEYALKSLKSLRLSRSTTKHVKFLLHNRGKLLDDQMSISQLKIMLAEPYFNDLYEFQKAIQKATNQSIGPLMKIKKRIRLMGDIELRPKPLLNGHELMGLGAVPGPSLGQLSQEMYIAQLEGKIKTKTQAKEWVRKWLKQRKETR